ncbi:MAG: hypothetical protein ACT4PG_03355 [Panacagrimonas sp.]
MKPLLIRTGRRMPPGIVSLVAIIFPVAAWLLYNWWDQPLDPAARALLEQAPEALPAADNLFLALLAFPIEGDEPAHERGMAALAAYERLRAAGTPPQSYADALDRLSARFDEEGIAPCNGGNREGAYECMARSRAQRPALEALFVQVTPLVLRYRELDRYSRYADPRVLMPDTPMADASTLRIALLHLSGLTFAIDDGSLDSALKGLLQSASTWRQVLRARDAALVDKMLASRALAAHTLFASELLRSDQPLQAPHYAVLESLLLPLSDAERSLSGSLAQEFRVQSRLWAELARPESAIVRKDFPGIPAWGYRLLFKQNDNINRSYRDLQALLAIEQQGCATITTQARQLPTQDDSPDMPWYDYIYNPLGRTLQAISTPSYLDYFGRQCNLLALQRMVGLQLELRRQGTGVEGIGSGRYLDPNTGKPFVYDAKAGTLSFEVIGKNKEFQSPLPLRDR